jgi:phosphatidylserine decarboxylase
MIRFGSRTELFLPLGTEVSVKVGEHVQGGCTIIGRHATIGRESGRQVEA